MSVRIALPADLDATSSLARRSLPLSEWHSFERPNGNRVPQHVKYCYNQGHRSALGDDRKIFTVIEASDEESDPTEEIVGFAIWTLAANQPSRVTPVELDFEFSRDRNVHQYRAMLLYRARFAIEPLYFRNGYGSRLFEYAIKIAREDGVRIGVVANLSVSGLYDKLGFMTKEEIRVEDDSPAAIASTAVYVKEWQ
ncbi:hypothetical protein B0T14DRAFT_494066 [Immersiella caudata]|uniref:N-acetyltransferase domain-containing protein n=1 Tax=Immersiella caudata TaxID=314043 RepID=A0AA39WVI7_9PEZI|nr:hypothetical protein B0T14DRAFT_494066 [Immersiella caudata]